MADESTLWRTRDGPIYRLADCFSGTRRNFPLRHWLIDHYANQHVRDGRGVSWRKDRYGDPELIGTDVGLSLGSDAFGVLFHMGVLPIAPVWEELHKYLSSPPKLIWLLSEVELAQFLFGSDAGVGAAEGRSKDELLTTFVAQECQKKGYRVPDSVPYRHAREWPTQKPPPCGDPSCHTCRPPAPGCGCLGCSPRDCRCGDCWVKNQYIFQQKEEVRFRGGGAPCKECREDGCEWDSDCPDCNPLSTPSRSSRSTPPSSS